MGAERRPAAVSPTREDGHVNKWRVAVVAALVLVTCAILMVGWMRRAAATNDRLRTQCMAIAALASSRTPATLQPGDFGYAYAKAHPEEVPTTRELQASRDAIAKALGCPNQDGGRE